MRSARPKRLTPAAASTMASSCSSANLRRRVSRLPRRGTIATSGRACRSWAARRRLLVPMRGSWPSLSKVNPSRAINTSSGTSRSGIAPMHRPAGISAGMSFMLWTAISIRPASSASSISFTNSPLPPTLARGTSRILSPLVLMIFRATRVPGWRVSSRALIQLACHRASLLPRVPMVIVDPISDRSPRSSKRCSPRRKTWQPKT